jgi:hypothetical protein
MPPEFRCQAKTSRIGTPALSATWEACPNLCLSSHGPAVGADQPNTARSPISSTRQSSTDLTLRESRTSHSRLQGPVQGLELSHMQPPRDALARIIQAIQGEQFGNRKAIVEMSLGIETDFVVEGPLGGYEARQVFSVHLYNGGLRQ